MKISGSPLAALLMIYLVYPFNKPGASATPPLKNDFSITVTVIKRTAAMIIRTAATIISWYVSQNGTRKKTQERLKSDLGFPFSCISAKEMINRYNTGMSVRSFSIFCAHS